MPKTHMGGELSGDHFGVIQQLLTAVLGWAKRSIDKDTMRCFLLSVSFSLLLPAGPCCASRSFSYQEKHKQEVEKRKKEEEDHMHEMMKQQQM